MIPKLNGIDHVHVYVSSRQEAAAWYERMLGFRPVQALAAWNVDGGPLTIEDAGGRVHLALFKKEPNRNPSSIAFGASGEEFLAWKAWLESNGLKLRVTDHKLAYSLYFSDPWANNHEITTADRDHVAARLEL